jgi:hypothetical protein
VGRYVGIYVSGTLRLCTVGRETLELHGHVAPSSLEGLHVEYESRF